MRSFLVLSLIPMLFGCSHGQYIGESIDLRKGSTIAVFPFLNLTSYPQAGRIVAEIMAVELADEEDFRILDPSEAHAVMKKNKIPAEQILKPERYSDLAKQLAAHYIITGSITEYRYTKGLAEVPTVAIQAKIIQAKHGKVIWRGSGTDTSKETLFRKSGSLDELTHEVCAELIDYIDAD